MKTTTKMIFAGVLLAASSAPLVATAAVNVDVVIGVPGYSTYYVPPQPVYYRGPAVVYAPRPYYAHRDRWDRDWDRHHRFEERRHW